jgi:large subunit ribosomal protein L3
MKAGMTAAWDNNLQMMPLTIIAFPEVSVSQVRTVERDGYTAVQVAAGRVKAKNVTKPVLEHLKKAGVGPRRRLVEFKVSPDAVVPVGTPLSVKHFVPGQYVDIQGISKGKGFQGGMKRWGFSGLPATHGVSLTHRSLGATGARQDPGKVWKGKKMPGRMGGDPIIVRNLVVWRIDPSVNAIAVRGSVPGAPGGWLRVTDASRKPHRVAPPFPTHFSKPGESDEAIEALLPPPPSWGPDVDWGSLQNKVINDPWPLEDEETKELDKDMPKDAAKEKEVRKQQKLKSAKGSRGKAIKLEKRLIKEGKLAPKTGAGVEKKAQGKKKGKEE